MSEYIIGLGISVKICKLYEELVYLTLNNGEFTDEYYDKIEILKDLIRDENRTYDRLDFDDLESYFNKISDEDISKFDSIKKRYYLKLKERKYLDDSSIITSYDCTLDTAIIGKIFLDTLLKLEKQFSVIEDSNQDKNTVLYSLYRFHKTYKYNLISSNDFLEKLAIEYDFDLSSIPCISFEEIKNDFNFNDKFYNYLIDVLYLTAKEIICFLLSNKLKLNANDIYSDLLSMTQLDIIINYIEQIDKNYLKLLADYCKTIDSSMTSNSRYVSGMLKRKLSK